MHMTKKRDRRVTKALGETFRAIIGKDGRKLKALNVSSGPDGGFLIPEELIVNVLDYLNERTIFGIHSHVWEMGSGELHLPMADLITAGSGHSPVFGGMKMAWYEDGAFTGQMSQDPSFGMLTLSARSMLGGTLRVVNQLVQDGGDSFADYIEGLVSQAIAWYVDKACFSGTGIAGEPTGIIYAGSTKTVTRSGGSAVAQADVAGLCAALVPASFGRAIWACNPSVIVKISAISGYQVAPGSTDPHGPGLVGWLMGRPLYVTEKLPLLNTSGDIILFDPMLFAVGVRQLSVEASTHGRFSSNQTEFRVIWRGDCGSLVGSTATLSDGTTSVGAAAVLS